MASRRKRTVCAREKTPIVSTIDVGDTFEDKEDFLASVQLIGRFVAKYPTKLACAYYAVSSNSLWSGDRSSINTACPAAISYTTDKKHRIKVTKVDVQHDHTLIMDSPRIADWELPKCFDLYDANGSITLPPIDTILPCLQKVVAVAVTAYAIAHNVKIAASKNFKLDCKSTNTLTFTCAEHQGCTWKFAAKVENSGFVNGRGKFYIVTESHMDHSYAVVSAPLSAASSSQRGPPSTAQPNSFNDRPPPPRPATFSPPHFSIPIFNPSPNRYHFSSSKDPTENQKSATLPQTSETNLLLEIDPKGNLLPYTDQLKDFIKDWRDVGSMGDLAESYLMEECKLPWLPAAMILSWLWRVNK